MNTAMSASLQLPPRPGRRFTFRPMRPRPSRWSALLTLFCLALTAAMTEAAPATVHFSDVFTSAAGGTETETLSARLPLAAGSVKAFTAQTPFHLQLGAFSISETLGDDPKYVAGKSTKANFISKGTLGANSSFTYLLVDLSWTATELAVTVSATPQKDGTIFDSVNGVIAGRLAGMTPGAVHLPVLGSVLLGVANANFDLFATGSVRSSKGTIEVAVAGGGDQTSELLGVNANDPFLAELQTAGGSLTFSGPKSGGLAASVTGVKVISGGKTGLFSVDSANLPAESRVSNGAQFHVDWTSATAGIVTVKLLGGVYTVNFPIDLTQVSAEPADVPTPPLSPAVQPPVPTGSITLYPLSCSTLAASGIIVLFDVAGPGQSLSLIAQNLGTGEYAAPYPLPDSNATDESMDAARNSAFLTAGQSLSQFQVVGLAISAAAETQMAASVKPPPYAANLRAAVAELVGDTGLVTQVFEPHDSALTTQSTDIVGRVDSATKKSEKVLITPMIQAEGLLVKYPAKAATTAGPFPTFDEELPLEGPFGVEPRSINNAKVGDTAQITTSFPSCLPKKKKIRKCMSGNSGVATVSADGFITCVGLGRTWISVSIDDYLQYIWIYVATAGATSPSSPSPSSPSPASPSPGGTSPSSPSPGGTSPSGTSPSTTSPSTTSPSTTSPTTTSPTTTSPTSSSPSSSSPSSSSPSSSSPSSSSPSSSSPSSSSPSGTSPSSSSPSSSSPSGTSPGGGSGGGC